MARPPDSAPRVNFWVLVFLVGVLISGMLAWRGCSKAKAEEAGADNTKTPAPTTSDVTSTLQQDGQPETWTPTATPSPSQTVEWAFQMGATMTPQAMFVTDPAMIRQSGTPTPQGEMVVRTVQVTQQIEVTRIVYQQGPVQQVVVTVKVPVPVTVIVQQTVIVTTTPQPTQTLVDTAAPTTTSTPSPTMSPSPGPTQTPTETLSPTCSPTVGPTPTPKVLPYHLHLPYIFRGHDINETGRSPYP
jgi:hypothetical protein